MPRDESGPYSLLREPIRPLRTERRMGIAASPGISVGRAYVLDRRRTKTPKRHIAPEEVEAELVRLDEAITLSDLQLERLKRKLKEKEADHSAILDAYQLILHDEYLIAPTRRRIRDEKMNAEWALRKTVEEIKHRFDAIGIEYFRERRSDVDFVGEQVLRNLVGGDPQTTLVQPPPGAVVVAHDLSPADTVNLHRSSVAAFVCDAGGKTSHTAILAQAFSIPAVVGLDDITDRIGQGDLLIVDGSVGEVILCPTPDLVEEYRQKALRQHKRVEALLQNRDQPAETTDGVRVRLLANIELPDEVPSAMDHGAEGIGLYRTEFLFLDRTEFPREEEHYMHARGVLMRVAPFPATFRTFDLGADKIAPFVARQGYGPEPNPALGLRSIRLCLKERQLFKAQLRGLLRASIHGRMRLMFPMISGITELREAKALLSECQDELQREGIPFADDIPVGIMIEMPSAVMVADHLAKEADFLSIGTNDLIQYSLALDRVNEHVGYLYQPLHPAILRMVQQTVEAGHQAGRRVGMCGEMAGEPLFSMVLLGLQLDDLSMNSTSVPLVKNVIRSANQKEARLLAQEVLTLASHEEIEALVRSRMAGYLEDRDPFSASRHPRGK